MAIVIPQALRFAERYTGQISRVCSSIMVVSFLVPDPMKIRGIAGLLCVAMFLISRPGNSGTTPMFGILPILHVITLAEP